MKKILFFSFLIVTNFCFSQVYAPLTTGAESYSSTSNPHYWKFNRPYADYWQQDVHYQFKAFIDVDKDMVEVNNYQLTYWNNSPDTLKVLYFHLIDNAFQPNSYYSNLVKNNKMNPSYGHYEKKGLNIETDSIQVNGKFVKIELDNTILKVYLNEPLFPSQNLKVEMNFKTYWDAGSLRRRNKKIESFGFKQFDGVHWYPSICVYDAKFGWTTDQHLDKEFYSNFGVFDIELTFPNDYVVEATGQLLNRAEVLPDTLRAKLDIRNFEKKPLNEKPSIITSRIPGVYKTWKYHAENVHNFAFTADPLYRIGEMEWKGIKVIAMVQEPHAAGWQKSALFAAKVIEVYSKDFGSYDWPKIIVADAQDGMEYPMITLDNGTYPAHQYLLAHEIGHMWFYGMLGSNETYRASMDEGFTEFLTIWSLIAIEGNDRRKLSSNKIIQKYIDSLDTRYEKLYLPYIQTVLQGGDEPLNTHSSGFHGAIRHGGNYGMVYYKTAVMLYNLQYVLGDELFLNAMKHYVKTWKFKHPYPEDFRKTIIEYTKVDLNWFFDQWLETTKTIDYSLKSVEKLDSLDHYEITIERKGRLQLPIDFTITTKNGISYDYHIPNTWFVKKTSATVLPKWYGWDLLQPEYKIKVQIAGGIKDIVIDPQRLMADLDLKNNSYKSISSFKLDSRVSNVVKWKKQENFVRPDLWYNGVDGVQIGFHANGNYQGLDNIYTANVWLNSGLGQQIYEDKNKKFDLFACSLTYKKSLQKWLNYSNVSVYSLSYGGLFKGGFVFEKKFSKQDHHNPRNTRFFVTQDFMYRRDFQRNYVVQRDLWSYNQLNSSITLGLERNYDYKHGKGKINLDLRTPGIASDFNYSYAQLLVVNDNHVHKLDIKTRFIARYGFGNTPLESQLYLAGAAPEALIANKYTRTNGFVPAQFTGYGAEINHFQMGGGLNVRGMAGYLAPIQYKGETYFTYSSNSGIGGNIEIDIDKYLKIDRALSKIRLKKLTKNFHVDTYGFADGGVMLLNINNENVLAKPRFDAGLGAALTYRFGPFAIKPLTLRFDMPLFNNTTPNSESKYLNYRYVIGVNRAF